MSTAGLHFFESLHRRVEASSSLLCIGLDPHVSQLANPSADEAACFCIKIIEETHLYAAAFKPNSAFFEAFGAKGFEALLKVMKVTSFFFGNKDCTSCNRAKICHDVLPRQRPKITEIRITLKSPISHYDQAIPSDIPIILDSKRGDIDTTAQAYATSAFDIFNASAVTLSPYMGWDSVKPFVTGYMTHFFMSVMPLLSCRTADMFFFYTQVTNVITSDNECYVVTIEMYFVAP